MARGSVGALCLAAARPRDVRHLNVSYWDWKKILRRFLSFFLSFFLSGTDGNFFLIWFGFFVETLCHKPVFDHFRLFCESRVFIEN